MDGAETTRRLKELMPEARILILTTFGTADGIAHALAAGAMGAVLKSVEFADLADAIRKVAAGGKIIDQEIRRFLRAEPAIEPLSPRQREILDAIVNGLSNADISARLGISLDMVKEHNQKLFEKLGISNRAEAITITLAWMTSDCRGLFLQQGPSPSAPSCSSAKTRRGASARPRGPSPCRHGRTRDAQAG